MAVLNRNLPLKPSTETQSRWTKYHEC
uniref:Uncharacterized protein n=1 Tax=Anguilla anguilla TaxID=7936 RepID=A0A0E9TRY5_ANGAN